jgi:hypothetical protein
MITTLQQLTGLSVSTEALKDNCIRMAAELGDDNDRVLRVVVAADRQMKIYVDSLSYAKENLTDPRKMALLFGLGTSRRNRIEQTLQKMSGAQVLAAAKLAEASEDGILAAAVILHNDALKSDISPFNSSVLAEVVFRDGCESAEMFISYIEKDAAEISALLTLLQGLTKA